MPPVQNDRRNARAAAGLPDPSLSVALRSDYEALYNDVHQANALAADFQRQEAGKSNEIAVLKKVFENAQADLARLCASIADLRQERHALANEAMRAMALERRLSDVAGERDRFRAEVEAMRKGLAGTAEEMARRKRESDAQIARMAVELDALRQRGAAPRASGEDSDVRAALTQISATLERLTDLVEKEGPRPAVARAPVRSSAAAEEVIDIAFEA